MEPGPLAQHEFVGEAVRRHRPRLGQAPRVDAGGHRLDQCIVQRVEDHERRDGRLRVAGIEPPRSERDVKAERHRPLRRRLGSHGSDPDREKHDEAYTGHHVVPPGLGLIGTRYERRVA